MISFMHFANFFVDFVVILFGRLSRVVVSCLMRSHYHLLLHQSGAESAGHLAQRIFNSYTKAFNKMYDRTSTLFESPFKAKVVDQYEYLAHLCRYIHSNPVAVGFVRDVEDWQYSNYLECVGKRSVFAFSPDFVTEYFGSPAEHEEFVREYGATVKPGDKFYEYLFDE